MTETATPKRSGTAEIHQQALDEAVSNLPALFLEDRITKKLKQQGVKAPKGLSY
jgi:hypothetical protein